MYVGNYSLGSSSVALGNYYCILYVHSHLLRGTFAASPSKAVERLNIKSRNFKDLLNDEPFKRGDIITLQDPSNLEKFDVSQFYHIKQNLTVDKEGGL